MSSFPKSLILRRISEKCLQKSPRNFIPISYRFRQYIYIRAAFMKRVKLDKIDRKILKNLQENGRITNVELAKEAGISAPPCLRRVRALEENGFIKGYHAKVDPTVLGYGVTV